MEYIILLASALAVIVLLYRDRSYMASLLIAAIVANVVLFEAAGQNVTSQRLVALVCIMVAAVLVVSDKARLGVISPAHKYFNFSFFVILLLDIANSITTGGVGTTATVNLILNLILYNLIVLSLRDFNLPKLGTQLQLQAVLIIPIIGYYLFGYVTGGVLGRVGMQFHTGYRLRADEVQNIINIWAASIALVIPLAILGNKIADRKLLKTFALVGVSVALVGVVLTFSRAAMISIAFFFLVWLGLVVMVKRQVMAAMNIGILVLLLGAIVLSLGDYLPVMKFFEERFVSVAEGEDESTMVRLSAIRLAIGDFLDHPLIGNGSSFESPWYVATENTFLDLLVRYGLVGTLPFLVFIFQLLKEVILSTKSRLDDVGLILAAVLFAYLFMLATNDFLLFSMGTILLAVINVISAGGERQGVIQSERVHR